MKRKKIVFIVIATVVCAALAAIVWNPFSAPQVEEIEEEEEALSPAGPAFDADSAYAFVQAQCDFGPRSMNSEGHGRCAEWIIKKFKSYGCEVKTQRADLNGYDGTMLRSTNIMASFNPRATTRIMLCAHWDSRPWADNDPVSANWRKPILAANDAASGVAVMLEIARLLGSKEKKAFMTDLGVDFVCFDAEDYGTPQWSDKPDDSSSWALGAQYFAANLPQGYAPRYGILLDMVGGQVLSRRHVETVCS